MESIVLDGRSVVTMITDTIDDCCTLLDVRIIEPEGIDPHVNGLRINCHNANTVENIINNLPLGGCYNYIGNQLAATDTRTMIVEYLFDECPP